MNRFLLLCALATALLCSCTTSPEKEGTKLAEMRNESVADFIDKVENIHSSFIDNFDSCNYSTRVAAREDFNSSINGAIREYETEQIKIERRYQQAEDKFSQKREDLYVFQQYYHQNIKPVNFDELKKRAFLNSNIETMIQTIIPAKPDNAKIALDLVGHVVREPRNGYFGGDACWKIGEGEFKVFEVLENKTEGDARLYNLHLVLQKHGGAIEVKCTARYELGTRDDWTIVALVSETFDVVKTGKYDNYVEAELVQPFFGMDKIRVRNNSDVALVIGGVYYDNHEWEKFAITVQGNTTEDYSDIIIKDFKIHFVEIPF